MQLLLFRHGIAEDHGPDGSDDSRRLTREGVAKTTAVARALLRFAPKPDLVLASPKIRAAQTAEIAAAAFQCPLKTLELLGDNDPRAIVAHLANRRESCLMLVGHEPSFSATAEILCGGEAAGYLYLRKAGCICLGLSSEPGRDRPTAQLHWMTTPKMLLDPKS